MEPGVPADYMNFLVTDTYYYNVDGKEVAFKASEKTPRNPDLFFTQSQSYWLGRCEKPLTELMLKLTAQL